MIKLVYPLNISITLMDSIEEKIPPKIYPLPEKLTEDDVLCTACLVGPRVRIIKIGRIDRKNFSWDLFNEMIRSCIHLESLEISSCNFFSDSETKKMVKALKSTNSLIKKVVFSHLSNISEVSLKYLEEVNTLEGVTVEYCSSLSSSESPFHYQIEFPNFGYEGGY